MSNEKLVSGTFCFDPNSALGKVETADDGECGDIDYRLVDLKKYIGVKIVKAKPMTYSEYKEFRNEPYDTGIEGSYGYLVQYPDGYISWCPKWQFEEANRLTSAMPFGHAIEAAKKGRKIARAGWNGKGMYLWLCDCEGEDWTNKDGETFKRNSYLYMKTAQNTVVPWLASQTDMLADDWQIVN